MGINESILTEANKYRGTWEWKGTDHNPKVLAMYADSGHPEIKADEVPWCAAFVGAVLARVGIQNTGSLLAKSYLKWGESVGGVDKAEPGDIVVLNRGEPWQGHVGFLVGRKGASRVSILGGNQGDQVNVSDYPTSRIAGIRRPKKPRKSLAQSTTVGASGVGMGGVVSAGVAGVGDLSNTAQIIMVVSLVVAAAAFAWIFRERLIKWAKGDR